ncbi:MAG TPA: hypothetical protein VGF25_08330 [Thermoleophilaceae bacterium]
MPTFLISPPSETEWRMGEDDFEQRLRSRWPDADVRRHDDPERTYGLEFTLRDDGPPVIGGLEREGWTVFVEGEPEQAARIARWFRDQVPPEQPLLFYDQEYSAQVELGADTQVEELAAPFG